MLFRLRSDLCSDYRQDQDVCAAVLLALLPSIRRLGGPHHLPEDMRHVRGALLQVVSGFWSVKSVTPSWLQGAAIKHEPNSLYRD